MKPSDLAIVKRAIARADPKPDELRPHSFDDIIGQQSVKDQLVLLCDAAIQRDEVAPHFLLDGPPGLGKTTFALAAANHMGGSFFATTGQTVGLETLGKRLSTQRKGSVLFIDEIHTLSRAATVMLLGALEDGLIDMTTPTGPERREVKPFTLIGATTDPGRLSRPLKNRFGLNIQMTFYPVEEIQQIVESVATTLEVPIGSGVAYDIASRSHGVPRAAIQFIQRIRDYASVHYPDEDLSTEIASEAFQFFDIDDLGLSKRDREYITVMYDRFSGGPVGGENLGIALGMDYKTVASDVEPLLLRLGLIKRANRGRSLSDDGRKYAQELLGETDND